MNNYNDDKIKQSKSSKKDETRANRHKLKNTFKQYVDKHTNEYNEDDDEYFENKEKFRKK